MTGFFYTLGGEYIARSEVVRVTDSSKGKFVVCRDGERYEISDHEWEESQRLDVVGVMPATPGYSVLERLTEDDGAETTHTEPLIGWAVNRAGSVLPVTAQGMSHGSNSVKLPDGRVMLGDGWLADEAEWVRVFNRS